MIWQEEFFSIDIDMVQVVVFYFGVVLEEVECGVCLCIEEVFDGMVGIDCMSVIVFEGMCWVYFEFVFGMDCIWVLGEIESCIGVIDIFFEEIEKLQVLLFVIQQEVFLVVVIGDVFEVDFKEIVY